MYIQAKSKKAINEMLKKGETVYATDYNMFAGDRTLLWLDIPENEPIKVFEKYVNGQPYAKSYGVKKGNKLS